MTTFKLPDLGEGLQEAEIVAWHVSAGDRVVADQPLVAVETDKAVVEVPSPRAGVIGKLCAKPGDIVKIGAPLVEYGDETAADTEADSGTVVGKIESGGGVIDETQTAAGGGAARPKATPAVRALARRLDVDLAIVNPSGAGGLVTAADIERAAAVLAEAGPLEPLRGVRRAMAQRMAQSRDEVAPATVVDDADIDAWPKGTDVTVRLVRAIAAGCAAEPALNAWYDSREAGRRLHKSIDLGIAVDTDEGLFVPVIHDVGSRDAAQLRSALDKMKAAVEARRVPPEQLRGGTFTLSNFGTLAGRYAVPVVVPPQVAILSAGRIAPRVVAVDGQPAVRRMVPLSLTFDHRAVTGGEAARFLAAAIADLEKAE
jgi:pyruvate dehydrogenase E2 component (dihydrolipoamide acetyltransferase)